MILDVSYFHLIYKRMGREILHIYIKGGQKLKRKENPSSNYICFTQINFGFEN